MIIAGIDEAGYGPILGPLVVGCFALRVAGSDEPACLWKHLRRVVSRHRDKTGRLPHVNDSKKVYSPAASIAEMERSVLSLCGLADVASLDALLRRLAPDCLDDAPLLPWYAASPGDRLPLACDPTVLLIQQNAVAAELARTATSVTRAHAYVISERRLNDLFNQTGNKGSTSFTFVARQLELLLNRHAGEGLCVYIDRQGGTTHYSAALLRMLPAWALEVVAESPGRAEYRLSRAGATARVTFAQEAEQRCLCVAMASMIAKYLREALMHRFNAWWQTHQPGVKPTKGYWDDGLRFLDQTAATRERLGITRDQLARSR